jgi:hypothetical protein
MGVTDNQQKMPDLLEVHTGAYGAAREKARTQSLG